MTVLIAGLVLPVLLLAGDGAAAQRSPGIQIFTDSTGAEGDTAGTGALRIRVTDERDREHDIEISIGGGNRSSGIVRFGENIVVNEGEFVDGDVVSMGGSIKNFGRITGDCVAMGGNIEIGEGADVRGDVVCLGGKMTLNDNARVGGDAVSIWGSMDRAQTADVGGDVVQVGGVVGPVFHGNLPPFFLGGRGISGGFEGFIFRMIWVAILIGLGVLAFQLFPARMGRLSDTVAVGGVKAFFAGLAGWILYLPFLLALFVTCLGIPVMILVIAVTPIALLFSYVAAADALGLWMKSRFHSNLSRGKGAVMVGIILIEGLILLSLIFGLLGTPFMLLERLFTFFWLVILFVALTTGFGALLMTRFRGYPPGTAADAPIFEAPPAVGGEPPSDRGI